MEFDISKAKHIYFIGIGGSSMSSLAEIMFRRGYRVSGSDMQESHYTERLSSLGISCHIGQKAQNIYDETPDVIIKTDAIADTNPEIKAAAEKNIPVFRRAVLLGEILNGYKKTIGIAGTHGKTTTSSMVTSILTEGVENPSAIIGGNMKNTGSGFLLGDDEVCAFESCEFKESYLYFHSDISVITNIAEDHMEYFKTKENLLNSFRNYLDNTKEGGTVVLNAEDGYTKQMLEIRPYGGKIVTFGFEKGDFRIGNLNCDSGLYDFDIVYFGKRTHISLSVPGKHNAGNAAAAFAASYIYGIEPAKIAAGLKKFSGVKRRFEYYCKVNGAVIADDYAHHPDAYKVTLETARSLGFKRVIAIHQPHTFSRTKRLMKEFTEILSKFDYVIVTPIYAARETNDEYNIFAEDVVAKLDNAEYIPDYESVAHRVKELARPGDLFITLSCGDIYRCAEKITELYGEERFL